MTVPRTDGAPDAVPFDAKPVGWYECQVTDSKTKIGKDSGKPYLALTWEVLEGDSEGGKLFSKHSYSEKALPILKKLIVLLELPNDRELPDEAFVGRRAALRIQHRLYEGKIQEDVVEFKEPRTGQPADLPSIDSFGAPTSSPDSEEDVPF